jgi:hypothetical protein
MGSKDEAKDAGVRDTGTITLTREALAELIQGAAAAASKAAIETMRGPMPDNGLDQHEAMAQRLTRALKPSEAALAAITRVPGHVSPYTGATFTVVIAPSDRYRGGRIITLEDYEHPAAASTHEIDGGSVPDGMAMAHPKTGEITPEYKDWRWKNFYQRDLQAYPGKPAAFLSASDALRAGLESAGADAKRIEARPPVPVTPVERGGPSTTPKGHAGPLHELAR